VVVVVVGCFNTIVTLPKHSEKTWARERMRWRNRFVRVAVAWIPLRLCGKWWWDMMIRIAAAAAAAAAAMAAVSTSSLLLASEEKPEGFPNFSDSNQRFLSSALH